MAAHRPEKVLGLAEGAVFLGREQADIDQFGSIAHFVDIFADPVERVQVAQAALALFDVRLDDIAAVSQPLVALVAFGQLLRDETALGSSSNLVPEAAAGLFVKPLIAPDIAAFEQRGADRQIAFGHAYHLVE